MDCSKWVSHDTVPVYLQLYEKMRNSILGGEIQPGGETAINSRYGNTSSYQCQHCYKGVLAFK